jgi:hypothetical protein
MPTDFMARAAGNRYDLQYSCKSLRRSQLILLLN